MKGKVYPLTLRGVRRISWATSVPGTRDLIIHMSVLFPASISTLTFNVTDDLWTLALLIRLLFDLGTWYQYTLHRGEWYVMVQRKGPIRCLRDNQTSKNLLATSIFSLTIVPHSHGSWMLGISCPPHVRFLPFSHTFFEIIWVSNSSPWRRGTRGFLPLAATCLLSPLNGMAAGL